jgi:hypothetical protein
MQTQIDVNMQCIYPCRNVTKYVYMYEFVYLFTFIYAKDWFHLFGPGAL